MEDSNLRRHAPADLQSAPIVHSGNSPQNYGAGERTRTSDLLITNQLLSQLSYASDHANDKRPPEAWQEIAGSNKNGRSRFLFLRRLLPDNFIHDGSEGRARVE